MLRRSCSHNLQHSLATEEQEQGGKPRAEVVLQLLYVKVGLTRQVSIWETVRTRYYSTNSIMLQRMNFRNSSEIQPAMH